MAGPEIHGVFSLFENNRQGWLKDRLKELKDDQKARQGKAARRPTPQTKACSSETTSASVLSTNDCEPLSPGVIDTIVVAIDEI